ncbi:class I SAM-dependent methyltransferase [Tunturiibacter psychrotolerans]|uniref:class I SAM-dependent methyltransferase n=1 Tax=Tunturiibacter psychrotolerans TaxID=3069686 RepID=UPI003D211D6A
MLNWAARYFPIIRTIKKHGLYESGTLLEIGSGPYGIGTFRKVPFTGCDLSFSAKEQWPMTQLAASAADLPLADRSFDMVLASDVLEHIPPSLRVQVISEALRVADKLVIFGFPCGKAAHDSDTALREKYLDKGIKVPEWLEEHMDAQFPEPELFQNLPGWQVEQFSNESLRFHEWMMKREMNHLFVRITGKIVRTLPSILEPILKNVDGNPSYRQIFVMTRSA